MSFLKDNLKDIALTEKGQKKREKEFRKEWNKWGKPKKERRSSLDEFGQAVQEIYNAGTYAITPILIFRELVY